MEVEVVRRFASYEPAGGVIPRVSYEPYRENGPTTSQELDIGDASAL